MYTCIYIYIYIMRWCMPYNEARKTSQVDPSVKDAFDASARPVDVEVLDFEHGNHRSSTPLKINMGSIIPYRGLVQIIDHFPF